MNYKDYKLKIYEQESCWGWSITDYAGDEDEIQAEAIRCAEEYEAEHADDWKYQGMDD